MSISNCQSVKSAEIIKPGTFEMSNHFYTKVLNAQLHPIVSFFLNLSNERIVKRYKHLNPTIDSSVLSNVLNYRPRYFAWAGSDLFHVTTANGDRQMITIETNSCPSGQKSMPLINEHQEQGGYRTLIEKTYLQYIKKRNLPPGKTAVVYDKNKMENSGYAAVLADILNEEVFLVEFMNQDPDPPVRFIDGIMEVRDSSGNWHPVRVAFRYVTQKPWNRIPLHTKTLLLNPVLTCLAGGRNKLIASKAYEIYNAEIIDSGLEIKTPETIRDVRKNEIPLWVKKFGGFAVIKIPYSNAGQGVYTITSDKELDTFMEMDFPYEQFIVQSLIGNYEWSSTQDKGRFYHVGTVPNKKHEIFIADLRMMIGGSADGFRPIAIYSRRSRIPLKEQLDGSEVSWDMLGTNLSFKNPDGSFGSDTSRLLLMDRKDFNLQGLNLDDLIEAYIQTVLSVIAIDKMSINLINQKGKFRKKLFKSLNNDEVLLNEIIL